MSFLHHSTLHLATSCHGPYCSLTSALLCANQNALFQESCLPWLPLYWNEIWMSPAGSSFLMLLPRVVRLRSIILTLACFTRCCNAWSCQELGVREQASEHHSCVSDHNWLSWLTQMNHINAHNQRVAIHIAAVESRAGHLRGLLSDCQAQWQKAVADNGQLQQQVAMLTAKLQVQRSCISHSLQHMLSQSICMLTSNCLDNLGVHQ